jgi:LysM repeat protein
MRQFIGSLLYPTMLGIVLCFAHSLQARPPSGYYTNPDVDELRIELDDLKHAMNTTQVELGLLDERLKKQDNTLSSVKGQNQARESSSLSLFSAQIAALEKKVSHLEKTLEKAAGDLRTLSTSVNQTLFKIQNLETDLSTHDKRLDEVVKLKGTLNSISKAIGQRSSLDTPVIATKPYRVKAGDSLEKIARNNSTSVDTIQKINNLSSDKIAVGQELRLPNDTP